MFRISAMLLLYVCSATAAFSQIFGGLMIPSLESQYPCISGATTVVNVINPTTGKIWMDRNLGATQVATSSTDANSYGDLYQWGRGNDGHQCRTSATIATLSSTDIPGNANFILTSNDWRSPQNTNLWQGMNGINNPCPSGYRIPTEAELEEERLSWSVNTSVGAFNSPLKLPVTGERFYNSGSLSNVGIVGYYWSSTVSSTNSRELFIGGINAIVLSNYRGFGMAVRCINNNTATLGSLNCGSAATTGSLFADQAASGVSTSIPYTGGNGGSYSAQSISSTGVTGLMANLAAGSINNGSGSLVYTISGTPVTGGAASFAISLGGQSCTFTVTVSSYPVGSVFCISGATTIVNVTNPTTGKIWMDRNLGASQVATSSTDANSYGDLYQWGRRTDGHQCRTSATTATLSSIDQPAHGDFIITSTPFDWRSPANTNLWQGVNGINNPCPSGYRIPTDIELEAERLSWSVNTSVGAFNSPLKLPMAGSRSFSNGLVGNVDSFGLYWSSTVDGTNSRVQSFNSSNAQISLAARAGGRSVRCIKN